MNLSTWMTDLPTHLRDLPIIQLAIPGTHNAMTYGINSHSSAAADATMLTRLFSKTAPAFVRRWAITQTADIRQQLRAGIRFFDLRIAQHDHKYYYAHGLLAMELSVPLMQLREYLAAQPREVVIIDVQHVYGCNAAQRRQLHDKLLTIFDGLLYAKSDGPLMACTLTRCAALGRQIVLISRNSNVELPDEFWSDSTWPTPWPNRCTAEHVCAYLDRALATRNMNFGYVSQCLVTPRPLYICLRVLSSLRSSVQQAESQFLDWISRQKVGPPAPGEPPKANVFLADFVTASNDAFPLAVVALNFKIPATQH